MTAFFASKWVKVVEVGLALLGVVVILLQNRGEAGMGVLGGGGEIFKLRRGLETILFYLTILIAVSLVGILLLDLRF